MGYPNLFATIVDDGVLVQVMINGSGTWWGGKELGKMFNLVSKGTRDDEGGAWGWDGVDRSFDNRRGKVLNRDVSEGDTDNGIFKLSVGVFILVLSGPLKDCYARTLRRCNHRYLSDY